MRAELSVNAGEWESDPTLRPIPPANLDVERDLSSRPARPPAVTYDYGNGLVEERTKAGSIALRYDAGLEQLVPADVDAFPLYNEHILDSVDRETLVYFTSSAALADKLIDCDLHPGIGALPAVRNPLGRISTLTSTVLAPLRGRRVVILGGATEDLREWSEAAASALCAAAVAEVRVACPPGDLDTWETWFDAQAGRAPGEVAWDRLPAAVEAQARRAAWGGYALNERGNARRLADLHGSDLRYCQERGIWYVWNGRLWAPNDRDALGRLSKSVIDALVEEARRKQQEAADAKDAKGKADAADLWNHARASGQAYRIKGMLELAQSEPGIGVRVDQLDADPWAFNVLNGTIDLRTGKLRAHRREDLCTKIAPVEFDPAAECPLWMKFLNEIMDDNAELIGFLGRATGYTLTGLTREQILLMLIGRGANGKSTFLETLFWLMGDYARRTEFSTFLAKPTDGIRNDLARLAGARFVASVETERGRRLAEVEVKQLTGGDTITARFLYHEAFEFRPAFKVWLAANARPTIRGTDDAIWRRIRLVPFDVIIPEQQRDGDLPEKLRGELPGILAWAVRGCLEWQQVKLKPPVEVVEATRAYRVEQDTLAAFIEECCEVDADARVRSSDLWAKWQAWAQAHGEQAGSRAEWIDALRGRGFVVDRTKSARLWRGLRLLPDDLDLGFEVTR